MSDIAIKVENLSKRYRIGLKEEIKDTFVGAISSVVRNPLKNLQKLKRLSRFGEKDSGDDILWALKDVSFEVKKGEVIGVIGRNGAGKSTLLKILSKITHPTNGRVELNGRVASLLEVGTGFHLEMTGRENIYLNGTILGMRKNEIDRKLDDIIDFSGVEKFIDTAVKRYSSGMRVRLAFSVAAHLEPEILLIDEVLAVGDAEFQKKCLGKMDEVAKGGRTVLFVSHNMSAVRELCSRGLLIQNGLKIFDGGISETIVKYASLFSSKNIDIEPANNLSEAGVIFHSVCVNDCEGLEVHSGEGLLLVSEFSISDSFTYLRLNFLIYDNYDRKVIHSQQELKDFNIKELKAGKYRLTMKVPALWLAAGSYSLGVKILVNGTISKDKKYESPTIPFVVIGETSRFGSLLQPDTDWQIQLLKGK